jgi:hypothetical protein
VGGMWSVYFLIFDLLSAGAGFLFEDRWRFYGKVGNIPGDFSLLFARVMFNEEWKSMDVVGSFRWEKSNSLRIAERHLCIPILLLQ